MAKSLFKEADALAAKNAKDAKLWKKELQLATKREKDWRDTGEKIIERYRGEIRKKNRFNVLWSNTEILRPAIYNTKPNPDVRRRFRDADPTGKAVSEVLERSLCVATDSYSFECSIKNDVLDALLPGRGLSRIRYNPTISQAPTEQTGEDFEASAPPIEGLENEQIEFEHVDWRDFRHGYGRTWDEVPWEGFRHKLSKTDAEKKFSAEDLATVQFTQPTLDDTKKNDEAANETQKVAEFWEIWDKQGQKVFFVQENVEHLLFPVDNPDGEPPFKCEGFFPNPEPLKVIENTGSTLPIPHFHLYEEQANELDKLSARIDKIVNALKLRGVYDAKLVEIANVLDSDDNDLTPVQNAGAYANGSLDNAIAWVPSDQAVAILQSLYEAREKQKAIIDELTGISDIIRGVTDANETYGAQQLKSTYAAVRLQRMQKEVQRYVRDLLRLAAGVMASKFGADTFAKITDLKFPTAIEKQQLQMRAQLAQQPQPGMPPPQPIDPALLKVPSWDEVLELMHSPALLQYRIDIETDSTIAGTLESDMAGLTQVMTGISQMLTEMAPVVQSGALPVDAAKELVMAVIRRARMGMAVEDAFDKMKAPNPTPPPPDHSIEVAQIKAQGDKDIAQMKIQAEGQNSVIEHQAIAQTETNKNQLEAQRHQLELQTKAQLDMAEKEHQAQLEQFKIEAENQRHAMALETQRQIADANNQTKLLIAEMQANQQAQMTAQTQAHEQQMAQMQGDQASEQQDKQLKHEKSTAEAPTAAAFKEVEGSLAPVMKELMEHLKKPKRIVRDDSGKIVGVH